MPTNAYIGELAQSFAIRSKTFQGNFSTQKKLRISAAIPFIAGI
jgi:hypothetical protein